MSGRGDNNQHGSSGRGSSNQSNQGFRENAGKSNHGKQTGGKASKPMPKERDTSADRNRGVPERGTPE